LLTSQFFFLNLLKILANNTSVITQQPNGNV
jgi:hypothetical protein